MDIAHSEAVEAEISRYIERRAQESTAASERAELWRTSEREYQRRKMMQARAAWFAYFCRQAEAHRKLSESYEARAEELCEENGNAHTKGDE